MKTGPAMGSYGQPKIEKRLSQQRTVQNRTGQDSVKKSQSGNISPIWGEAPTVPIEAKICTEPHLADVITCAKFQDEIFRGYNFTGGSNFPFFLFTLHGP